MCLTHCHFTLCCNLSLCPAQGCFGAPDRRARGFTRMDRAVIASFALRWKVQRCPLQLLALFLELRCQSTTFASAAAVVATACCFFIVFHSCPTHVPLQSFPARSESLSLRCLNCVPVSHTCSGVVPVQVHPTQAIWRTTENLLFVLRYTMLNAQFLEFPFRPGIFVTKSASLLVPGIFRIVASRLWNTSCTHKPLCVHVSNLPCTHPCGDVPRRDTTFASSHMQTALETSCRFGIFPARPPLHVRVFSGSVLCLQKILLNLLPQRPCRLLQRFSPVPCLLSLILSDFALTSFSSFDFFQLSLLFLFSSVPKISSQLRVLPEF